MQGYNPNRSNTPYAPQQSWMSKQTNGSANPYGFGQQRLDGKFALQRNVAGLPTNTMPLPQVRPQRIPQMMRPMPARYRPNLGGY